MVRWNTITGESVKYTTTKGLADNFVRCIAVDSEGLKWFGTWSGGVSRFDGVMWKTYTMTDGLGSNINNITLVNSIAIDPDGSLWFGTDVVSKFTHSSSTGVAEQNTSPAPFILRQNYPNPFNPSTAISFTLHESGRTRISIFNLQGQMVKKLVDERLAAGAHTAVWDGMDVSGKPVESGVYLYEFATPTGMERKKMLLVR